MKKNVGKMDKIIRLIVAAIIVVILGTKTVAIGSTLGIVLAIVAVIFTFTALANWCAIYALIGASTCPVETSKG